MAGDATCFRCKKVFPRQQLIGRRFHKYCKRCLWIDTMQMVGAAIIVFGALLAAALFYNR